MPPPPLVFCLCWSGDSRDLHSFPTRRSSDLVAWRAYSLKLEPATSTTAISTVSDNCWLTITFESRISVSERSRSEEHTSELQSRPQLVCRLLLEKKKNIRTPR